MPAPRQPSPRREPLPPDAIPEKPAVRQASGVQQAASDAARLVFKSGVTFSSAANAASAPFRSAWSAAAAGIRVVSAMLRDVHQRPIVHLAAAPAAALIRTLVVAIVIPPEGPPRFLAPRVPDSLVGSVSSAADPRKAALAVARAVLSILPVPALHAHDDPLLNPLLIPAFERVPASGDPVQTVDRVIAVPLFSANPPPFSSDHDGWLHWVTLAAASSLLYALVAHAVNRVRTYRTSIPRVVLDSLMNASSRLRSGALEPRRLSPATRPIKRALPGADDHDVSLRHRGSPPALEPARFADALAKSLAVDEHLRRTLLAIPDSDPLAAQLHAFADRVQPADLTEIPPAFLLDGGLPKFSNPELFLTPFSVRVQPPRTAPLPPVPPQILPPADFHPQDLGDLLTPEGATLLRAWYIDMYDYLILIDDLAPLISVSRRRRAAILDRAAAGDNAAIDEMIAILVGDVTDGRDPTSPAVRDFLALVVRAMSPARPLPWNDVPDEPAGWPELKVGLWEGLFLRDPYYNGPSDDSILQDILHARPEPLALGASCFDPRARGVVWDLRGDVPRPVDYCAPIDTHFNLDFVRAAQRAHPTYPDQEMFDHLLFGVRFKSHPEYQMILQPHLSSLPLGYENMHKELRRLRDKGFFQCFKNPPFAPWQTLSNGVAFRKLEPDRPRRTTDGGSPRRGELSTRVPSASGYYRRAGGSDWLTDTDGRRVVPINSTRWPEEDLQRGTLEVFYRGWRERLRHTSGSPPPFHPLLSFEGPGLASPQPSRPPSPAGQAPDKRRAVIIFSGEPDKPFSLSKSLREQGWSVQDFDLLEGGKEHNVLLDGPADFIVHAAELAHFVWLAPPCSPYSVAAADRPHLFSVRDAWWADDGNRCAQRYPEWADYIRRAVAISRFVARVILACHARRIPWVVENPPRRDLPGVLGYWEEFADLGSLWHVLNADSRLAAVEFQDVTFPYCALGAPYQKATTLRSNCRPLVLAFRSLACAHDRHADRLQGLAGDGRLRTRLAAAYPLLMIERVCQAVDVATRVPCTPAEDDPAEDVPAEGDCFSRRPGPSASARGQLSLSSRPAAPALPGCRRPLGR
jgi:hypothetical protein